MSKIYCGHQQLLDVITNEEFNGHILYVIDEVSSKETLEVLSNDLPDLNHFKLVSLNPSEDHDIVYMLRRAARRLLQGPDGFPLYVFATPHGLPYYSVTAPPAHDSGHQVGLETHLKKVLEALSETPTELVARAESLAQSLSVPKPKPGPVHGQLVKRALEAWSVADATPAQCVAASRIGRHYPAVKEKAVELWQSAWAKVSTTSELTDAKLLLLTVSPEEVPVSIVSQIEAEVDSLLQKPSLSLTPRVFLLLRVLQLLSPESSLYTQGVEHLWNCAPTSLEDWQLSTLSNFTGVADLLSQPQVEAVVKEFLRRTHFATSSVESKQSLAAFAASYQEAWDSTMPDPFANACYNLATFSPETREQLISLIEAHSENINAEPKFYPSLLSLFVQLHSQNGIALEETTSREPLVGKASAAAQKEQLTKAGLGAINWPGTGLLSAPLGMGTLRMQPANAVELLNAAWTEGVRVFDVGANFAGGQSERLVGEFLHQVSRDNPQARSETTVITRIGLVTPAVKAQWDQVKQDPTFDKASVSYQSSTLCLAPKWLEYSLSESFNQLGLECIDVALIAQPELFLLEARERNAKYRDLLDEELENLLIPAFKYLEEQCQLGRIQFYGVVSGTIGHHGDAIEHLSPELIKRAAEAAGGSSHKCRVIQAPLNLLETGLLDWQNASAKAEDPVSTAEFISQNDITLLTHRPLNAAQGAKLHRFAALPEQRPNIDFGDAIKTLKQVEETLRDAFNLPIRLGDNEISLAELFHFADELEEAVPELGGLAEWEHLNLTMISPRMQRLLQFMDQLPDPEEAKAFAVIRPTWIESYEACLDATFHQMREKSFRIQETFEAAYQPLVDEEFRKQPAAAALSLLVEVPMVACTLAGPTRLSDFESWRTLMKRGPKSDATTRIFQFSERVQALMRQPD